MYLFSIVMPIYNADRWLDEAFNSIVGQKNIDFENEVEVILVNDCSTDGSKQICLRYCNKYKNVKYVENMVNKGSSSARNSGLRIATGVYINFFDSDDILSNNVLYEVKCFAEKNKDRVAHISIPLVFFEAEQGLHAKYKYLGSRNRIVDLQKEPGNFILSSASSFYKRMDIVDNRISFDESMFCEEDTKLNFELYKKVCPKYAYICENGVAYHYRRRKTADSQVDRGKIRKEAFYTLVNLIGAIKEFNSLPNEMYYELCIYELRSRLKNIKSSIFGSDGEFYCLVDKYRNIIREIPEEFIVNRTKFLDINQKILFLTKIYSEPLELSDNGAIHTKRGRDLIRINDLPLDIKSIGLEQNDLKIEIVLNFYGIKHVCPVLVNNETKTVIYPTQLYETDSVYVKSVDLIKSAETVQYAKILLPLEKIGKYKLYYFNDRTGFLHVANKIQTYSENPFLPVNVFGSLSFKKYTDFGTAVVFYNKVFTVTKSNFASKIFDRIKSVITIYKKSNKLKWLRFCKFGKPKYWLFNDRPINANDNAEALFTFVNENYPKIAKRCYYVLSKNSTEIERIKKVGNVVIQNSLKHKFLYLNAKYILTSHLATQFFKPISFGFFKFYNDLIDSKIVWLQHGITMNDIESGANRFHKQINKLVVAAKFEEKIFTRRKYFFENKDILQAGFTRYDILNNESTNMILIMPTWRSYLSGRILSSGMHAAIPGI